MVLSPNFLVWKFCGKARFPHRFGRFRPKLCGNCVFPQNFHTRKLGEITVFFAVIEAYLALRTGAQLGEKGKASPPLFENQKKCPDF